MKISIVYGTRPELLKLVPLIKVFKDDPDFELTVINTGQHQEMLTEIERRFEIVPDFKLDSMKAFQSLTRLHTRICDLIEPILLDIKPELVLLQGDTATVAAVGLVCFFNKIAVGHVEAGLRSFNLEEPFPEEFNRRSISIFAKYNFAPTELSANNLRNEKVDTSSIFVTGNTIVDMVRIMRTKHLNGTEVSGKQILVTSHRRENHGDGILNICNAIKEVSKKHPDLKFIWPLHPNPNVKGVVEDQLGSLKNVMLTAPMDYFDLVKVLESSYLVWTDSGGIQEECPSFVKPCLILRNVTERPEVVDSGFGMLVGTNEELIVTETLRLLEDQTLYKQRISGSNPFGDGFAADQIKEIIKKERR